MKSRDIFVLFLIGFVLFVAFKASSKEMEPVVCTADAKICPDGSAVGRVGPNCQFAECPIVKEDTIARLNQTIQIGGIYITPLEVISDSRCPEDVTCIWAGEVKLKVRLASGINSSEVTLTLGTSAEFLQKKVNLIGVSPGGNSKKIIKPADYLFEFTVL